MAVVSDVVLPSFEEGVQGSNSTLLLILDLVPEFMENMRQIHFFGEIHVQNLDSAMVLELFTKPQPSLEGIFTSPIVAFLEYSIES